MEEIHAMLCLIRGAPCAETAERLFRERCCVEGILEPDAEHQGLQQFIIRKIGQFLD